MIYIGRIEDCSSDPTRNMRYKVRVIGVHNPLQSELSTADLPWATAVQNESAAMSGIGKSANHYLNGSTVVVIFLDSDLQIPFIIGALAGVPSSKDYTGTELYDSIDSDLSIIPPAYPPEIPSDAYIGSLNTIEIKTKIIPLIASLRGNNPKLNNEVGVGKFQHSIIEMQSLGYLTDDFKWTNKNGISNVEQYLNTPNEQLDAEENLLKIYYTALCQLQVITQYTPKEKQSGVLVAAHVIGLDGIYQYLTQGSDVKNSVNESVSEFYKAGYKVIAGVPTEEQPTVENINSEASDKYENHTNVSKSKYEVNPSKNNVSNQGFKDPDNVYPLPDHENEPDTPRLATGIKATQTILGFKENVSVSNIPVANSSATWKQSPQPYNAQYPKNHVFQSESGHVMEFDDTKGAERVHIAHRSGTFSEIDADGNNVERTMGVRTVIVDKDELVYIKGSGHVTIDGDMSLKVKNALHVEITGNANFKVSGDVNYDISGAMNIKASSINMEGTSSFNLNSGALLFKSPTIIQNPYTGDIVFSGHSTSSGSVSVDTSWSPKITIPAPVTRKELQGIELEDTDASKLLAGKYQHVTNQKEDKVAPTTILQVINPILVMPDLITYDTRLSANFKVRDVCVGDLGSKFPFLGQHGLTAKQLAENLRYLALNVLEPVRKQFLDKGFAVNSVIRPSGNPHSLKDRISQHELGMAADISFRQIRGQSNDREQFFEIAKWIKDNILFDQLILEYRNGGSVWIHISFNKNNNRRQVKTMNNDHFYSSGLTLLA